MVNRQNAKKVYRFLKSHPEVHAQNVWMGKINEDGDSDVLSSNELEELSDKSPNDNICGTNMCVAGATTFLLDGKSGLDYWAGGNSRRGRERAAELLGLDQYDSRALFYTMSEEEALDKLKGYAEGTR